MNPSANTPPAATARDYSAKPYRTAWVAAWWFIDFAITATAVATGQLSGLSLNYLYLVIGIFLLGLQTDVVLQLPEHATPRAIYGSSAMYLAMSAVMCLAMLEPGRFVHHPLHRRPCRAHPGNTLCEGSHRPTLRQDRRGKRVRRLGCAPGR